jgi:DNA-binding winged helix-turn-helix (wHTH) protein
VKIGAYDFDPEALTLARDGVRVDVPARALEVLRILAESPNHVVDKRDIFMRVWPDGFVESNNLWQQVHLLRKALAGDPRVQVANVPRRGYRLVVPVEKARIRNEVYVIAALILAVLVVSGALWILHPRATQLGEAATAEYRRGLYHLARRQPSDLQQARAYFDKTVAEAPNAPDGYAARAVLDIVQAQRALQPAESQRLYDEGLADERAAFARGEHPYALLARASRTRSRDDFERAMTLAPNDPTIVAWYGFFETSSGDPAKGELLETRATKLDPSAPIPLKLLGIAAYYAHDYAIAEAAFRDELNVYAADDEGWYYLGLVDQARLHPAAAREDLTHAISLHGGIATAALLARAYLDATSGRIAQAKATFKAVGARPAAGYQREGVDVAALWMAFGRPDDALSALEHIDRSDRLVAVAIEADPRLASLPFRRATRN